MMKLKYFFVLIFYLFSYRTTGQLLYNEDWWNYGNFYQIYPRSFKDSDGDGIGDLAGITEKLAYLKNLGITGTWLSPIFKSPMVDFGYDISDYYSIQPEYGTLDDFDRLVARCIELGIKLIIDFVPNHTSDQHQWFLRSVNGDPEYADFYVWHSGKWDNETKKFVPPSNWLSVFGKSAWEWNEKRKQFYLHQFAVQQPDLNYRNPNVIDKMNEVLRFWLDRGVSGFRVDAVASLVEAPLNRGDGLYPDEPNSYLCSDPAAHCYLNHIYTENLNETFDIVYQWREFIDQYQQQHGGETRILMTETFADMDKYMLYYGDGNKNGSQIPFNFLLLFNTNGTSSANDFKKQIDLWLNNMPKDVEANWVLGNHDRKRIGTRYGSQRIDLINILLNTLPGISITYYGEEIGMTDAFISWEDTVDVQACLTNPKVYMNYSRDPARTPFQWDGSPNAGFSTSTKTWLPVANNYMNVNVRSQLGVQRSHLKVFQRLTQLKKNAAFRQGSYEPTIIGEDIFVYKRQFNGRFPFVVLLNFGNLMKIIDLKSVYPILPDTLKIVTCSIHAVYKEGDTVDSRRIIATANVGIVFSA